MPSEQDFRTLLAVNKWEDLAHKMRGLLGPLGVHGFLIRMRTVDGSGRVHMSVLSSLADTLLEGLAGAGDEDDPVAEHVGRRSIPLVWSVDGDGVPAQPYAGLRAAGVRTGWSVGARGENSFSRVDFYSRHTDGFALRALHSELLMLSCYLHEAARTLWLRDSPKASLPVLTAREKQCLRWSASGKTSNEIGTILGISQNTVYFHLKKAAGKFDVYGTRHAISRAMELGLL